MNQRRENGRASSSQLAQTRLVAYAQRYKVAIEIVHRTRLDGDGRSSGAAQVEITTDDGRCARFSSADAACAAFELCELLRTPEPVTRTRPNLELASREPLVPPTEGESVAEIDPPYEVELGEVQEEAEEALQDDEGAEDGEEDPEATETPPAPVQRAILPDVRISRPVPPDATFIQPVASAAVVAQDTGSAVSRFAQRDSERRQVSAPVRGRQQAPQRGSNQAKEPIVTVATGILTRV